MAQSPERPVRELLDCMRKARAPEHEVMLLEFLDLSEQEQREFLFLGLIRLSQWIKHLQVAK